MMRKILQQLRSSFRAFRAGQDLKHKAARGTVWVGGGSGTEQALRLLRNMILARLVAPEAFGLMAIVSAISTTFESLTEIGIQYAIIQDPKGHEQTYLNGAWWLSVWRAVGLYTLSFAAAPWVAQFYGQPALVSLIRVAFLSIVFNGALSPRAYVALKQMDYKRWVVIQHGGGACGILMAIAAAAVIPGVWALVLGLVVESAARCALSHALCPFRPGRDIDRESWQALKRYAQGVFGVPALTLIFMKTDIFVVGKLCPPSDLGVYSMAIGLAQMPYGLLGPLLGRIAGPAFSELQGQNARLNGSIVKVTSAMALLGLPLVLCLSLYGKPLLLLLYGSKYAEASRPFSIAVGTALLQILSVPVATLYFMIGRPDLHRFFTAIRAALVLALIYPAVKWFGLTGAAAAGFLAIVIGFVFQIGRLRRITGLDLRHYSRAFWPALGTSFCVLLVWIATHNLFPFQPLLHMMLGSVGCLFAYMLSLGALVRSSKRP